MDSKGLKVQAYTRKPVATRTDLNRSGSGLAHTRNTRKSAGNIYEEIMGQMEVEHNKYIRQLVTRN